MSIELKNVTYTYSQGTAYESHALKDINLVIPDGQFIGVIGHTGSGKSTLIQHFNALIQPTSGQILYNGEDVWAENYNRRALRSEVGLVFQYPEHQLFENTVLADVCFGPMNQGLSREQAEEEAKKALAHVGVKEENFTKSPFELSGGQKKRVAIAGVLAMNPKILILDEPTAGLDPQGRDDILDQIAALHDNSEDSTDNVKNKSAKKPVQICAGFFYTRYWEAPMELHLSTFVIISISFFFAGIIDAVSGGGALPFPGSSYHELPGSD